MWRFVISGKHIHIQKPKGAGSQYYSYKQIQSINLMAIADSRYCFLVADLSQYESESDGGV